MILHQSDLSAYNRCAAQYGYKRQGWKEPQTSAAAFGSVVHHAMLVFERARAGGDHHDLAVRKALETFVHYWHPLNIDTITSPVEKWLPHQSFGELRSRGIDSIEKFCELVRYDDAELLGTEFSFMVPIAGTWDYETESPHVLAGSIDRLVARRFKGHLVLGVDDFKTGKEYAYLRQNLQFTAYCYASTTIEFWVGAGGEDGFGQQRGQELFDRFDGAARRGTWINMRKIALKDAGWRGPIDYQRFALACQQIYLASREDIFPLALDGNVCEFCAFTDRCGGVGVAPKDHGAPGLRARSA